jgi:hypothetical protein
MHLCPLRFWACTSSCARSQPIAGGAQCRQSVQGKCLCPANLRPACSPVIDDARCHALRYWRSALPAHSDQDASARTVTETSAHSATGALRHVHFGFELHVLTHPTRHRPIAFVRSRGLANRRPAAGCVLRPGHAGRRGEHAHNRGRRQTARARPQAPPANHGNGSHTTNAAPPEGRFSAHIRPPLALMIPRQIARPRPVPGVETD